MLQEGRVEQGGFVSSTSLHFEIVRGVDDFRLKKSITDYPRVGKMDSTNVKIFSVVDESFEKK